MLSPRKTLYNAAKAKKKARKYQSNVASALHYISNSSLHGGSGAMTPSTAKLYQMTTAIAANLKKGSGLINRKNSSQISFSQPKLAAQSSHQPVQRFGDKAAGNVASAAAIYTVGSQQPSQAESKQVNGKKVSKKHRRAIVVR